MAVSLVKAKLCLFVLNLIHFTFVYSASSSTSTDTITFTVPTDTDTITVTVPVPVSSTTVNLIRDCRTRNWQSLIPEANAIPNTIFPKVGSDHDTSPQKIEIAILSAISGELQCTVQVSLTDYTTVSAVKDAIVKNPKCGVNTVRCRTSGYQFSDITLFAKETITGPLKDDELLNSSSVFGSISATDLLLKMAISRDPHNDLIDTMLLVSEQRIFGRIEDPRLKEEFQEKAQALVDLYAGNWDKYGGVVSLECCNEMRYFFQSETIDKEHDVRFFFKKNEWFPYTDSVNSINSHPRFTDGSLIYCFSRRIINKYGGEGHLASYEVKIDYDFHPDTELPHVSHIYSGLNWKKSFVEILLQDWQKKLPMTQRRSIYLERVRP